MNVQIKLAEDRVAQLRGFAKQEGVSMNAAVGKLFRALYAHTDVTHNIPSVQVSALSDGLAIRFPNSPITGFSFDSAAKIAQTIREYLTGKHAGEKLVHLTDPNSHTGSFAIWRKGNAIKVAIPANAPEKNFTTDLAEDFAEILEAGVAKVEA
ncbi:hypothetical protein PEL8287_03388 [Roseovarius litorisediminis]|uniref:Uncharacterized protein n=1 Tax=Roseovarius litorisediminis TaxID=1312363 RepID=A0A1Y5THK2_9RHOB|nr:hypothetical protein [Roseovarius litorisediminis]SLN62214.1 hypothetical protein PEL8287_03388 [Roseovarius litorisediminis]